MLKETHFCLSHIIGPIPISRSVLLPGICSMTPKICSCAPSLQRILSMGCSTAARKDGNEDHDKFGLPTGSGFVEDRLKVRSHRFITDAQFGRGGPKCFACDELKCQSGLGWRQSKATPQQINGLGHVKARDLQVGTQCGAACWSLRRPRGTCYFAPKICSLTPAPRRKLNPGLNTRHHHATKVE